MSQRIVKATDFLKGKLPNRKLIIVEVGHGRNTEPLKIMNELLPGEKHLIGIDKDPQAARNALAITSKSNPSDVSFAQKVDFKLGMADKLPLKDNSVDVLMNVNFWWSSLTHPSYHNLEETGKVEWPIYDLEDHLKEAHRVLNKDTGHLVVDGHYIADILDTEDKVRALLDKHKFDIVHRDTYLIIAKPRKG